MEDLFLGPKRYVQKPGALAEAAAAIRAFGRRPLVLALVYYECPMLCTQVLNGLVGALGTVNLVTGTAVLHAMVPNQYLGRVMSLSMMSMGFAQVNGLTMGLLAQGIGLETTVPLIGGLIAICVLSMGLAVPQLRRLA